MRTGDPAYVPYDKRKLSYAQTFQEPWRIRTIRAVEWATGKLTLLRKIRQFEREGVVSGNAFWDRALEVMGIELKTPPEQIARFPKTGPVVVVSNHPHGLVDGMIFAATIGKVRTDYKILSRSLLAGVKEVSEFLIAVPFPHEEDSFKNSIAMRNETMEHLKKGGVIALFPSGQVASAKTWFGPAVEAPWNPFTAKLVRRSGATVVPMFFPGQNSRWYQIAAQTSATLRQGLLLHEVVHALNKPQAPVIGEPITPEEMEPWKDRPGEFIEWLRARTLALKDQVPKD
ncbi:lysophospholipid acyltransferase family protein [Frigidibacter sp. ROC022]|uniref:lysophospholipid acyltransferase family protein n=1 Tax=Frigidibacter sp. ROC022 TaxID=2971796 RepID=UPI00215A177B|nr:lysophospholipid acyltransferase family protein [Frigidibacter sp. ROC022]MCR8726516.1 lysophospholipid acyltransferase family protein [Frigidibacter sp. ROC022]